MELEYLSTRHPASGYLFTAMGLWDRGALNLSSSDPIRELAIQATEVGNVA